MNPHVHTHREREGERESERGLESSSFQSSFTTSNNVLNPSFFNIRWNMIKVAVDAFLDGSGRFHCDRKVSSDKSAAAASSAVRGLQVCTGGVCEESLLKLTWRKQGERKTSCDYGSAVCVCVRSVDFFSYTWALKITCVSLLWLMKSAGDSSSPRCTFVKTQSKTGASLIWFNMI